MCADFVISLFRKIELQSSQLFILRKKILISSKPIQLADFFDRQGHGIQAIYLFKLQSAHMHSVPEAQFSA